MMQTNKLTRPEWMVTLGSAVIDIREVVFVGGLRKESSNFRKYCIVFESGFEITVIDNGGDNEISMKRDEFLRRWAEHRQ